MKKIRIGYYDDSKSRGGTTRYLMELLPGLDRDRFDIVFFAPRPHEWHADLVDLGAKVVTAGDPVSASGPVPSEGSAAALRGLRRIPLLPQLAWTAGLAREIHDLKKLFQTTPVDLLHSNNTGAEPAPIAARLAGIPCIVGTWQVDSTYDLNGERQGWHYRALEIASMRSLDQAIALSQATADDWVRRCHLPASYRSRIHVIPTGIDMTRAERTRSREEAKAAIGISADTIVIGSLGRLEPAKGYEFLVRALPPLLKQAPRTQVLIAGAGPLERDLKNLAASLGVGHAVTFTGFVRDVRSFLECLDIYVQPSLCEALGIALVEAGALGLPRIASNVGGIKEVVLDGTTGYLTPPKDAAAIFSAALMLTNDEALRARLGQNAREQVKRDFTRDRMIDRTIAVYNTVLAA